MYFNYTAEQKLQDTLKMIEIGTLYYTYLVCHK